MPSSLELTRALIQDHSDPPLISDVDIELIVAIEPNAYRAAEAAARSIAASLSERVDMGAGSSKLALSQQAKAFLALADELGMRAQNGGDGGTGIAGAAVGGPVLTGVSISDMIDQDRKDDRYQGSFKRGQNSNPPTRYFDGDGFGDDSVRNRYG